MAKNAEVSVEEMEKEEEEEEETKDWERESVIRIFLTLSELLSMIIQTNSETHGKRFKNAKFY